MRSLILSLIEHYVCKLHTCKVHKSQHCVSDSRKQSQTRLAWDEAQVLATVIASCCHCGWFYKM